MAKQPPEPDHEHPPSVTTFSDLKNEIAARNEATQKEARELRSARELAKLGIATRRRVDLNQ
jgi:hypothetical protein